MLIKILIYSTFLFLSFGQLGRISFLNQQVNLYLYEVAIVSSLFSLIYKYGAKPISLAFQKYKIIFLFFFFLLFSFIIGFPHFELLENFVSFLYLLRLSFYFIFFFYLSYYLASEKKAPVILKNGLTIFITVTVITSLGQYFFYPDLRNLIYAGWDPHLYRMFGLFFDTSIAGGIYGLIFLLFLIGRNKIVANVILRKLLLVFFLIFIVLTFSRSLYVVVFITTILVTAAQKWYKFGFIFLCIFLLLIFIVPKPGGEGVNLTRIFTIQSRFENYKLAIQMWKKNPLLGIGYNRIRYVKIITNKDEKNRLFESHSGASFHSSYLIILVTTGLIGLMLFLGVLYKLSKISQTARYVTLFLGLLSLSDNIFLHPFVLFLYLTIILFSINLSGKKR